MQLEFFQSDVVNSGHSNSINVSRLRMILLSAGHFQNRRLVTSDQQLTKWLVIIFEAVRFFQEKRERSLDRGGSFELR